MPSNHELLTAAAAAIRQLQGEVTELRSKVANYERVQSIVSGMHKSGSVVSEDIPAFTEKLSSKTTEELDVVEKALEMQGPGNSDFTFGKLSERPQDDGSLDPLTSMLLEDY
jgi:phage-related minor tail protein